MDVLIKELKEAGYDTYLAVVLDSTQFGVPQKRNRFFILACRFPNWWLQYPDSHSRLVGVGDALAGLPNVIANSGIEGLEYTDERSDYSDLMRNDVFWKRETFSKSYIKS